MFCRLTRSDPTLNPPHDGRAVRELYVTLFGQASDVIVCVRAGQGRVSRKGLWGTVEHRMDGEKVNFLECQRS